MTQHITRTDANQRTVRQAMAAGAKTAAAVADATGLSVPTANKYMLQLVASGAARITNTDAPKAFANGRGGKPERIFEWLQANQPATIPRDPLLSALFG